jgi:hypothetical protein
MEVDSTLFDPATGDIVGALCGRVTSFFISEDRGEICAMRKGSGLGVVVERASGIAAVCSNAPAEAGLLHVGTIRCSH